MGQFLVRVASLHWERCTCHADAAYDDQHFGPLASQMRHSHPYVDERCSSMWESLMRVPDVRLVWDGAPLASGIRTFDMPAPKETGPHTFNPETGEISKVNT